MYILVYTFLSMVSGFQMTDKNIIQWHTVTFISCLFSPRALLLSLRLPNTESLVHVLFGSFLRSTLSLNSSFWLLDKQPWTGAQEAGNYSCMVEISQLVWAPVWTNPSNIWSPYTMDKKVYTSMYIGDRPIYHALWYVDLLWYIT